MENVLTSPDTLNHIWPQQFEKGAGGGQMQPLANYRGPFISFYIDPQNNVEVSRVHYPNRKAEMQFRFDSQ